MKALLLAAALPACLVSEDGGIVEMVDRVAATGETTFLTCPADPNEFRREMERQAACIAYARCHRCYRFTEVTPFPMRGGGCGAAFRLAQYDNEASCARPGTYPARPHDPDAGAAVVAASEIWCKRKCDPTP